MYSMNNLDLGASLPTGTDSRHGRKLNARLRELALPPKAARMRYHAAQASLF